MTELWSPIPFFPYYQASNKGNIRSLTRWSPHPRDNCYVLKRGNLLTPRQNTTGRLQVTLHRDGEKITRSVHSLVCEAFHGPRPKDRRFACHINGDHLDNRPENLYWGTPKQNYEDAVNHGRTLSSKTHCVNGHEYTEENVYLRPDGAGRVCRTCTQVREEKYKAARRLELSLKKAERD